MRVGLLGGSFNPPHIGHLHISNLALKKLRLQQIWWLPTAQNPLKEKSLYASYKSRVASCLALTAHQPKIRVKKFDEIYTTKLIVRLQKKYPNIEFFWLMGADNLHNFHRWNRWQKIIVSIPLAIFSREKDLRFLRQNRIWKKLSASRHYIFFTKNLDISSTQISSSGNAELQLRSDVAPRSQ